MKSNKNSNDSRLRLLGAAIIALAGAFGSQPLHAGTTWDGGGGSDTTVTNDLNWGGTVNALDGTQPATFASGGSNATLNVNARFKTLTFNNVGGFTINGPGTLTVSNSTSSTTINLSVTPAQGDGVTVLNTPMFVDTGSAGTKLLVLDNSDAAASTGPSLIFSNTLAATVPANTWAFRLRGTGITKFGGAVSNCSAVQPALATYTGTNIFAGRQILGSSTTVWIPQNNTSGSAATARIQMGESTSDIQSWGSSQVQQLGTLAINSKATLSGGVSINTATTATVSGGIVEVNGALSATTLGLGSSGFIGNLKIGGLASFSGAVTIGSAAGNTIVGNSVTGGTLALASGTISSSATIGGGGENENNLNLVKFGSGTLNLGGTHTYTGTTLVTNGTLNLSGTIASSITVSNGATLTGEGSTTGSLTFGPGTSALTFDPATPESLTVAGSVNASGATVYVNPTAGSGVNVVVLQTTGGTISGTPGVNFVVPGGRGTLSIQGGTKLVFTGSGAPLVWKGNQVNATNWDMQVTTNWSNNGSPDRFFSGDSVTFNDTASSFKVTVTNASVSPGGTTFSNNANAYTLNGGSIGGAGSFTKSGTNTVTVLSSGHAFSGGLTVKAGTLNLWSATANNFTGGITNNGGTLVVSNINQIGATGGGASLNAINLNGGTLSYTGPTITSETLTFNLLGGVSTIDVNDAATGTNVYTLRTGAPVTGSGDLVKTGNGDLTFGKNSEVILGNTFTGKITVKGGIMDIRNPDSLGDVSGMTEVTNAMLLMFPFGQTASFSFDPEPVSFSGASEFRYQPPTGAVNTTVYWTGPVTNSGVLNITSYPNTNGATLTINSDIVNNGLASLRFGYNTNGATTNINNVTVSGIISGAATVATYGTNGSLYTFLAPNTYTGDTILNGGTLSLGYSGSIAATPVITVNSNATLDVSGVAFTLGTGQTLRGSGSINGNMTADGTIAPGPYVGTLTFTNDLTINGNLMFKLNKSLAQSNDVIHILGTLNNAGNGTLTVSNAGPGLVAGDRFTLFSQLVPNGQNLTIVPPAGVTITNNLADDGSITVLTAPPVPTSITYSFNGSTLSLSWPASHLGWYAQSNSVSVASSNSWFDVPGSPGATSLSVPINPALTNVFYRLRQP